MKKCLWLIAVLCLLTLPAMAQEGGSIASFLLPEGAQTFYLPEGPDMDVPEGLSAFYELMTRANRESDVYLVRMKFGRALVSVSCTNVGRPATAQALLEKWPDIAQRIASETQYVNADPACAAVEMRYGFESLVIRTDLAVGKENMLLLKAVGTAFYRENDLIEVWEVFPSDSVYLYNEAAARELRSDRTDLSSFLSSLNFAQAPVAEAEPEPYTAPSGACMLSVPKGCTILDPASTAEQAKAVREQYIAANPEGAADAFDVYYRDVAAEGATLIFTEDMHAVIGLYALPDWPDLSPAVLCSAAGAIRDSLREKFGAAACLVDNARQHISGTEHSKLAYEIGTGFRQTLLVLSCVQPNGTLREVDFFLAESMPAAEREKLMNLVYQTLSYLPAAQKPE